MPTIHEQCVAEAAARERERLAAVWSMKPVREEQRKRLMREGRWKDFEVEYLKRVEVEGGDTELRIWDELVGEYGPLSESELPAKVRREIEEAKEAPVVDPGLVDADKTSGNKRRARRAAVKRAAVKKKSRVDIREVVEWVFANIGEDVVDRGDEPCAGAYNLLMRVKDSQKMQDWFYSQMFVKLLPTRAQVEGDGRFRDTGQNVVDFIERVVLSHGVELGDEEERGE